MSKMYAGIVPALVIILAGMLIAAAAPTPSAGCDDQTDRPVSFRNDVFPIIEEHCLPCHLREERNMSRLFLDDYELLMKGGFNGPPVEPGDADESLLVQKISENPPFGDRMPMRTSRYLNEEEIRTIIRWIDEGAHDN
jgi:hypothetical protein